MTYPINFLNGDNKLKESGLKSLENTRDFFDLVFKTDEHTIEEIIDGITDYETNSDLEKEIREAMSDYDLSIDESFDMLDTQLQDDIREFFRDRFSEYGLCYDYVELDDNHDQDYFRYQISYGGPSTEVRFYDNGAVEFVYLDWFVGVGFDVKREDCFQALAADFRDCEMMDFHAKREEYDYYEILANQAA